MESALLWHLLPVVLSIQVTIGLTIISKSEWGGHAARETSTLANGLNYVIIHHTAGSYCDNKPACMQQMRILQTYHQTNLKWADIGYNFLIGGDGNVYEGRGWNVRGAHVKDWNAKTLGISFMGNYNKNKPNAAQISAAKSLLDTAVRRKQIKPSYILYGHRQVGATECPGTNLWNEIRQWPRWKPEIF